MSEHRMVRFGLAALVIVLLLGAGAASLQQSAWSQGYMMGLIAGNDEGDALSQYVLYNSGRSPSLRRVHRRLLQDWPADLRLALHRQVLLRHGPHAPLAGGWRTWRFRGRRMAARIPTSWPALALPVERVSA